MISTSSGITAATNLVNLGAQNRGSAVVEQPSGRRFQVRFTGPKEAEAYAPMVTRIIEMEKPAYVTFELAFASREKGG